MTTREQQIIDTLIYAIKSNSLVEFKYEGKNRKVEPYLIGELYSIHQNHLEEGIFALRAWFVSGYSSQPVDRKQGDRWRVYHLEKMSDLTILDETNKMFRPLYNPNDKYFKRINFRVQVI
ncbi:MAG: WYL domain-containing protein [Crocinitomicaceae bacterium]|nr:WYL domain-containing protein [Crocinitomicaceae bacterium]